MTTHSVTDHSHGHHHDGPDAKATFGFWIYIMTDCMMFAALFATYIVLRNNTYGGPGITLISNLHDVLARSIVLLVMVLTSGLSMVAMHRQSVCKTQFWLIISFLIGLLFLGMQYQEFDCVFKMGYTWQSNAFMSAYFTTVGLFCVHIVVVLLWTVILMIQLAMQKFSSMMQTRLICLNMFLNFLSIIWIFVFSIVYLMGAI
ncbi:MAG: cytochrome c oxidase subunit 3 [Gammaproteobacteria bacterium]|nr:cytochrome c oxidase subunit 3 [Gammaproteobacteria bacterium]